MRINNSSIRISHKMTFLHQICPRSRVKLCPCTIQKAMPKISATSVQINKASSNRAIKMRLKEMKN